MCTHTAHLKIWIAGSDVKIVKFWILAQALKVCLWGANTHPKPFLDEFWYILCIRKLLLVI